MARLIRAAILLALVSTARIAFATTYYIDNSGSPVCSDTAAGTQAAPWCHLPGMVTWTGTHTPAAGDRFILRGGDTWGSTNFGIDWLPVWAGTSANPIYIGVDKTYHAGTSWARPIFTCNGTPCANTSATYGSMMTLQENGSGAASYVTIDNIEWTGFEQPAGSNGEKMVQTLADHTILEHCYFHGWSVDPSDSSSPNQYAFSANASNGASKIVGSVVRYNVFDGAGVVDASGKPGVGGGIDGAETVQDNVFNDLIVAARRDMTYVYGNLVTNIIENASSGHCDGIYDYGPLTGTDAYMHDNVIAGPTSAGCVVFWSAQFGSCPSCKYYVYDNLVYNVASGSSGSITVGNHSSYGNTGSYYIYNNTLVQDSAACIENTDGGNAANDVAYYGNNHCIGATLCDTNSVTCTKEGTNLLQTAPQADANTSPKYDQYAASETYAYSPLASTNSTVGAGTNQTSLCAKMAGLCKDITYATYDRTNHTVVMARVPPNARPSTGAWDIGAYQFEAAAGAGGTGGTGGSGVGGSAGSSPSAGGTGASSAVGGSGFGGTSGTTSDAGAEPGATPPTSSESGGCGCHVPRQPRTGLAGLLLSLAGLGLWLERRRRAGG